MVVTIIWFMIWLGTNCVRNSHFSFQNSLKVPDWSENIFTTSSTIIASQQGREEELWLCHTVCLLVVVAMVSNMNLSGQFCVLYLVWNDVFGWTFTVKKKLTENNKHSVAKRLMMPQLLLDRETNRNAYISTTIHSKTYIFVRAGGWCTLSKRSDALNRNARDMTTRPHRSFGSLRPHFERSLTGYSRGKSGTPVTSSPSDGIQCLTVALRCLSVFFYRGFAALLLLCTTVSTYPAPSITLEWLYWSYYCTREIQRRWSTRHSLRSTHRSCIRIAICALIRLLSRFSLYRMSRKIDWLCWYFRSPWILSWAFFFFHFFIFHFAAWGSQGLGGFGGITCPSETPDNRRVKRNRSLKVS